MKNEIIDQKTFIDKTEWPRGEWDQEPDKIQWIDAATGLDALMVRHPRSGNWCGYVGVAAGHPAFEKDHDAVDADVHGGLTFASFCVEDGKEEGICHVAQPGRPERVWWLGFDCAHWQDLSPGMQAFHQRTGLPERYGEHYRNVDYVEAECAGLAQQLAEMTKGTAGTQETQGE